MIKSEYTWKKALFKTLSFNNHQKYTLLPKYPANLNVTYLTSYHKNRVNKSLNLKSKNHYLKTVVIMVTTMVIINMPK